MIPAPPPFALKPYLAAYSILLRDLHRLLEFVEPRDENGKTYSHRIYELLLRVCTEFESVCKDLLLVDPAYPKKAEELNAADYRTLDPVWQLSRLAVQVTYWGPKPRLVTPFAAWASGGGLPWYQDYNTVKHNRNAEFALANLFTLTEAFAGLFLILRRLDTAREGFDVARGFEGFSSPELVGPEFQIHY